MPPEQAGGEVDKIDERADVFGLGAILCVILTGQPPYVGDSPETVRLMAVRGQLADCLARLDRCGAEPGLVELCKRCLSFTPTDRPRNADEVAKAVVALRSAAEDRARQAELNEARAAVEAAEQRKRRQIAGAMSVAVVLALVAGATATFVKYRDEADQRSIADGERKAAEGHLKTAQAESQAKDEALQRLTEQQRITEESLLLGLLRPLRGNANYPTDRLTGDEARALRDLGTLPDERLRHRFVELALATPDGPGKLWYRAAAVVHALVGWDAARAARLRDAVHGWLAGGVGGLPGRVACVELLLALPPGEPAQSAAAAEALIDWLIAPSFPISATHHTSLVAVLARLGPDRAASFAGPRARVLADRMARESEPGVLHNLVRVWSVVTVWVEPVEAANQAHPVASAIATRITDDVMAKDLYLLVPMLRQLAARLRADDAATLVGAPTAAMVKQLAAATDMSSPATQWLLAGISSVSDYLGPPQAGEVARSLAEKVRRVLTVEVSQLASATQLVATLSTVLSRLPQAEARAIAAPLAREMAARLSAEQNPVLMRSSSGALLSLIRLLSREDAAAIAGPPSHAIVEGILKNDQLTLLTSLPFVFDLVSYLDEGEAKALGRQVVQHLVKLLGSPRGAIAVYAISNVAVSTLALHLTPQETADLVRTLAVQMFTATGTPPSTLFRMILLFAHHTRSEDVAQLIRTYSAQLAKETNPEWVAPLVELLATLSRWQSDGDLAGLLRSYGGQPGIAPLILAEFNRRLGRLESAPTQALAGTGLGHTPPFASVWELIAWAEVNRPDIDFRSPPGK
jgi:hypothetical protein